MYITTLTNLQMLVINLKKYHKNNFTNSQKQSPRGVLQKSCSSKFCSSSDSSLSFITPCMIFSFFRSFKVQEKNKFLLNLGECFSGNFPLTSTYLSVNDYMMPRKLI